MIMGKSKIDDDQGENECVILPSLNGVTGMLLRSLEESV